MTTTKYLILALSIEVIGSLLIPIRLSGAQPAISVGNRPAGIAIGPDNTTYVVNSRSNTVSVIDPRDRVIATVQVGNIPFEAVYNHATQTVDVTNSRSNTVSVIDPLTKRVVDTINVGTNPRGMTIGSGGNLYVANSGSDTVSVITGFDIPIANIPVDRGPRGVTTSDGTIYVTNTLSSTVSIINSTTNSVTATIPVGIAPTSAVAVGDKIYMLNSGRYPQQIPIQDATISVIDGHTNRVEDTIATGLYGPETLVSSATKVYVFFFGEASVMDVDTKRVTYIHLPVNCCSYGVYKEGLIYASGFFNGVYVIDAHTNKTMAGLTYNVEPSDSGEIYCNGNKTSVDNTYVRYPVGTELNCKAEANNSFFHPLIFKSWSWSWNDTSHHPFDNPTDFNVEKFGTLTASFRDLIPSEYASAIVGTLLGIGITAIGSLVYKNWEWFNDKRGVYLKRYTKRINTAYEISHANNNECLELLREIKKQVTGLTICEQIQSVRGKISKAHYNILNDKITEYVAKVSNLKD